MYDPISAREDFKNAAKIFQNAINHKRGEQGKTPLSVEEVIEMYQLTQTTLRLEQPQSIVTPLYTFPISTTQQGAQNPFLTELRLQQTDTFVPTNIFVGLGNAANAADIAFKVFAYPSPVNFPTSFGVLNGLYNGQLKMQINNYQYLYGWDVYRHYLSPMTQQTAPPGPASPVDQFNYSTDGFYPMQPYLIFNGLQNLNLTLILPGSIPTLDAATRIIIFLRGVIAQNSTVAV